MKTFNGCVYTQIRIDLELRQLVRVVCASESIKNRREFCERSLDCFMSAELENLIAPARRGVLFRVEMSLPYQKLLEELILNRDANVSRIFHTAIFRYIENFKKKLPERSLGLITMA